MILLYDGVCGLCNDWVQFTIRHDPRAKFRFAPLQGPTAARILGRHGKDPAQLDTVYLVLDPEAPQEKVLSKSAAVLELLRQLGGIWRAFSVVRIFPRALLDFGYDFVARHRYRWFGQKDSCPIPSPEQRARFLE